MIAETGQMIEELVSEGCYSLLVDMEGEISIRQLSYNVL